MTKPRLILASGSPRRQQLLNMLNVSFAVIKSNVDEQVDPAWTPAVGVERLAEQKALAVAARLTDKQAVIIAADTTVALTNQMLGKPANAATAKAMLRKLQGKAHDVFTGLCVYDATTDKMLLRHVHTRVFMRPRDETWINQYVATGEPLDKAGAYGIQGLGSLLVERIEGDYYNVVGLPLGALEEALAELGRPLSTWLGAFNA